MRVLVDVFNMSIDMMPRTEQNRTAEAKRIEKERTEKYTKMKSQAKDERTKFREKVLNPKKYN